MNSEKFKKVLDLYNGKPIEKEASIGDLDKSETFDIVQSKGDTNQIRKVAVSLTHEDEGFVLSANFEDDWTPLFKITADDNSIEEDYVTSVELLKKIQASVDSGNLDEAKTLFSTLVASAEELQKKYADDNSKAVVTKEEIETNIWNLTYDALCDIQTLNGVNLADEMVDELTGKIANIIFGYTTRKNQKPEVK